MVVRQNIFTQTTLSDKDVERLVSDYQDRPIAFFANLKASLVDDILIAHIQAHGLSQCISKAKTLFKNGVCMPVYYIDSILGKAAQLAGDTVIDHLQDAKG